VVLIRSARGWLGRRSWCSADDRWHIALIAAIDTQLVLGLSLYVWLSPLVRVFLLNPGAAMADPALRFFGVEHITAMLIGIALLHVGRVRSKRIPQPPRRHRMVCITTAIALALVLAAVPWPNRKVGRPLLPAVSAVRYDRGGERSAVRCPAPRLCNGGARLSRAPG
jgi:hypothetical protein